MPCFADRALYETATIEFNQMIARDTMRIRVRAPEMAARVLPGQFFMVRLPGSNDPLIGRAFALFDRLLDSNEQPVAIDLVYLVKGKLTSRLAKLTASQAIELWGPLGNSFSTTPTDHLIMVAGGIGQTPFLTLARQAYGASTFGRDPSHIGQYAQRVSLCYGARSASYLAGVEEFREAQVSVHIATEDGSLGFAGRVTSLLEQVLDMESDLAKVRIVCCGPEPMMEAVSQIAARRSVVCEVSLETPMACGIGICFSCVAKIGSAHDWDYKRTCVEGPIFPASTVQWH